MTIHIRRRAFSQRVTMARKFCFLLAASAIVSIGSGCILSPSAAQALDWKRIEPETGGFSCEMPGEPKVETQQVDTIIGPIKVVQYVVNLPMREFVISSTTIPPNAPVATTTQRLDGSRDGAVKAINGTLLGEKELKLGSHDGREILIEKSPGLYVHQRFFVVEKQIVQAAVASTSKEQDDNVIRFFKSMQLLEK